MSMLAEKKSRTKWIPNPQGNLWGNDNNKFGQKILEKMGWSPGQGLGVQKQGRADVLRVQFKNDSKGLGFKGHDEYWTKHQDEFNGFLSKLTEQSQTDEIITPVEVENKPSSLELKSSQSRARIHYHKFTRGKDLSQYSDKDLAAILGTSGKADQPEVVSKNHINAGSMEEYFKRKHFGFKSKDSFKDGNDSNVADDEGAVEEENSGDQKVLSNVIDYTIKNLNDELINEISKIKKMKKRLLENDDKRGSSVENGGGLNKINFKQKRKSKTVEVEDDQEVNHNVIQGKGSCSDYAVINVENEAEFKEDKLFKKKSYKNVKDNSVAGDICETVMETNIIKEDESLTVDKNKVKIKRKSKNITVDEYEEGNEKPVEKKKKLDDTNKKGSVDNFTISKYMLKKSKKINKRSVDEGNTVLGENNKNTTEMLNSENIIIDNNDTSQDESCKQRGEMKKNKESYQYMEESVINHDMKGKKQKKKSKDNKSFLKNDILCIEEENVNGCSDEMCAINYVEGEKKQTRRKSKSKRRDEKRILQNDICNEEAENKEESSGMKSRNTSDENNVDNNKGELKVKRTKSKDKIKVPEDATCIVNTNGKVKTTKRIKVVAETLGEQQDTSRTSNAEDGFVSLNYQNRTLYSSQENYDSNQIDYRSYNNNNAHINQYSYNYQPRDRSQFNWNNMGCNFWYSNRGANTSQIVRGRRDKSDMAVVRSYFAKHKLLISEPQLNFNGANVGAIKGYGQSDETS